ncbi:MAG: 16S rRNA (adenine(1518)-N(6)/adenine(1519)-N(6))-dimethyltransferase RsmA [Rhodospirillales bacterium]|nr:16S rRNA (adenine(1518)-N(6)/adenine(1519)-N(6))-dimethyltransferase RsmA [Rhodospirillales bacterium]
MTESLKTDNAFLDALPSLRDVVEQAGLRARKALGQNFILDQNVTDRIARAAGDLSNASVFEIGPGPGGLTRSLLRAGARKVIALEYDPRAVAALEDLRAGAQGRLEILAGDALETDLLALDVPPPRVIVANLPYNIATPLLVGWLRQVRANPESWSHFVLMFQREVADRLIAAPGTKEYGRLSVLTQWLCSVERLFDLAPSVFVPPPKVTSSVVRFSPRALGPESPSFRAVESVTAAAFGQRRKMLRSTMKADLDLLESCGIDPTRRAETLSISDFVTLARLREARS